MSSTHETRPDALLREVGVAHFHPSVGPATGVAPWVRGILSPSSMRSSSLSEDARAFLQKRTARYGLVLGLLGLGFYLMRVATNVAGGVPEPVFGPSMLTHLFGASMMFLLFALNATGARPERFVRLSEVVLLSACCVSYGLMASVIPPVFRPDATLTLIFATLLLTRAIYVPSSWRWTATIATTMGVALGGVVYDVYSDLPPSFTRALVDAGASRRQDAATSFTINALTWWVTFGIVAASASQIIYGLRRDVAKVRQLGQYTLLRKIGEGGVGMVYEAKHAMLRRPTAVKLLQPEKIDENVIARFEREVRATAALNHPNTVTVFDYGRTPDGVFYYAMERVPGATLSRVVAIDGAMPPERVLALMFQIASGLCGAHEAGLIHRDVKPDNVLLGPVPGYGEIAKLVDFGLVLQQETSDPSLSREGSIVGTPQYLAPETIRGATADARSDLYALGAVGFFLLTAEHVFGGKTVVEVCSMHLTQAPDAPSKRRGEPLPPALDALILRLLEKDPADRFASAAEVQAALEKIQGFGTWTPDDARRWWNDLGPDVREAENAEASTLDTEELAVDLRRRT